VGTSANLDSNLKRRFGPWAGELRYYPLMDALALDAAKNPDIFALSIARRPQALYALKRATVRVGLGNETAASRTAMCARVPGDTDPPTLPPAAR
jgi:hypothetical protein